MYTKQFDKKNKKSMLAFILILMIALTTLTTGITNLKAQTDATIKSYVYLAINPNPVGVDQQVTVDTWVSPLSTRTDEYFNGLTVTITAPDGTTETKGPFTTNVNGGYAFAYTPTKLGNYTFKSNYPGEKLVPGQYLPSESQTITLQVQQEPIPYFQDNPLPADYWTRPINGQNRLWASISGDWLMAAYNLTYTTAAGVSVGALNPYSQAPGAPHIMWTKEITTGGLVGGEQETNSYYSGPSYSSLFSPPIVMNGKLYYSLTSGGTVCLDQRTGQELWRNDNLTQLTCGQEYNAQKYSYTTAGVQAYLWTRSWQVYDPFDGTLKYNYINYPSTLTRPVFSDDGSILNYVIGRDWLALWNSSLAGLGTNRDWNRGIQWNVTIPNLTVPESLFAPLNISSSPAPTILGAYGNVLLGRVSVGGSAHIVYDMGYDLTTGEQLWYNNYTKGILTLDGTFPTYWHAIGDGVLAQFSLVSMKWNGYDINTGKLLWVSDPQDYPWGDYTSYYPTIAYGKLYSLSYDGCVHAFDVKTGKEIWKFFSGNSGLETTTGTYPFFYGPIIADGVLYASNGFETPQQPLTRGARTFALNATTGDELWNMNGMLYLRAIADGYLLGVNVYDSQIYCIGKGPSKTTVSAPQVGVTTSTSITISGTITDIAAGSEKNAVAANYPNGLPCVSDASEGAWMSHVYGQQPLPNNVTGVPITINVLDANGNYRTIGTTTSQTSGTFAFNWTPDISGAYTVYAVFEGSESYYPSNAVTYFYASESAATPTPQPTQPPSMADLYFIPSIIGVIIAIIVVGVVLLLAIRKRP